MVENVMLSRQTDRQTDRQTVKFVICFEMLCHVNRIKHYQSNRPHA